MKSSWSLLIIIIDQNWQAGISRFGFERGICLLIAPVPVHCFSISFSDIQVESVDAPMDPRTYLINTILLSHLVSLRLNRKATLIMS